MLPSRTFPGLAVRAALAVGLAALASNAPAGAATPHARPPAARKNLTDSFLPTRASSVAGLIRQVQTNAAVRRNYARYLRIPEDRVAGYLRQNLVTKRLNQAGRYTMFLVRPSGLIYPVTTTVPRGARVFALSSGAPLLSDGDGNPIKQFKTPVEVVRVPAPPAHAPGGATVKVAPSIEDQTLVPVAPQETVVPTIVLTPVYRPASPLSPAERAPEAQPGVPAEKTASKP